MSLEHLKETLFAGEQRAEPAQHLSTHSRHFSRRPGWQSNSSA
jgi:hypothetical protein